MKNFTHYVYLLCCILIALDADAQTTLISATGNGGFETGSTPAANSWTAVNSSTDSWVVGSVPGVSAGTNCAYITSNGGTSWTYSQFSVIQHLYYDVTIPAGESKITLSFKWKAQGEGSTTFDYDNIKVFFAPNSVTPTANTAVSSTYQISGPGAISGMYKLSSAAYNSETIVFSGTPGSSYRLIFSWKADVSTINNPPAAIDEVSLVSDVPATYTWNQASGGAFSTAANWTPNRNTPLTSDILVFDGAISAPITSVPTQTVGQIKLQNNATPNLTGSSTTLTVSGGVGDDVDVASGSTLSTSTSLTLLLSSGTTANIAGTLSVGSGTTFNTTNGVTTVGGTITNSGTITGGSASTLIFSSGSTYNHAQNGGTVPTANYANTSNCNITGITTTAPTMPTSVGNLTWNCTSQTGTGLTLTSTFTTINGNFTVTSTNTGSFRFGATTKTVSGDFLMSSGTLQVGSGTTSLTINGSFTQSGGTVDLNAGTGTGTLNVKGAFTQSAGTITETSTGTGLIVFNGTSNQAVSISGTNSGTVSYTLNNAAGVTLTGTIPVSTLATMTISSGTFSGSGTVSYSGVTATLAYNGSTAQTSTDIEFPSSNGPTALTINNASGVSLHASRTIAPPSAATALTLTTGVLNLGANDLTIGLNGTISVTTPGVTKMVQADGAGQLKKVFATGDAASFTFPIGDATSTAEYSPVTIDFATNSVSRTIGVKVTDSDHPSNSATDRISRYWTFTDDQAGTYTYTGTFTYVAADIVGTEGNMRLNRWNGSAWTQVGSSAGSNVLTISSATNETTGTLGGNDFTGRTLTAQTYVWNQTGTASFATAASWTPNRTTPDNTDILVFNNAATTVANNVPATQTIAQIQVSGNTNVTLTPATTSTLTIGGATGTDLDIASGSTLVLSSSVTLAFSSGTTATIAGTLSVNGTYTATNATTTVTGTVVSAGTITSSASNLSFDSGSNCNMTTTSTTIPIATWNAASNLNITGIVGGTTMTNAAQSFGNVLYNCAGATGTMSLFTSNTVSIGGSLTIQATNTGKVRLTTTGILNIAGNFNVTGGTCDISNTSGTVNVTGNFTHSSTGATTLGFNGAGTLNVSGDVTVSAGTLDLTQNNTGTGILKVGGTFNHSGGTFTTSSTSTSSYVEFNGASAQSVTPGTIGGATGFRINNAAGITLTGSLPINNLATLTMIQGAITGTVAYTNTTATGAILAYAGTAAQTTTDVEFPSSGGPGSLTINNTAGVTLHASRTVNPPATANIALTLSAGVLALGNNDLTIGSNGTVSVSTPSATKMVLISGTGQLKKIFPSGASSLFTFPIGENTGTTEYSPIAFTFTANSTARTIGVSVVDAVPPSNGASTTYISRYWPVTNDAAGTYTFGGTMTYLAADVVGTEASLLVQFNNGSFYTDVTSSVSSPTLTITAGATETTVPFDNTGNTFVTGRRSPPTSYTWNGTSGDWGVASNWTPSGVPGSIDNVTVGLPGLSISGSRSIGNFTLNGTGTVDLPAAASLTINGSFTYDNSSGATATFNCTSTVTFGSSGAVTIPALSFGNLTRSGGGATTLAGSGTIGVCGTFTPGAGSYTNTGSTVDFTGSGSQTIPVFSFNNLSNSGGGARTLASGTIGIDGVYNPTSGTITIGTSVINFSSASSQTIPASSYYSITNTGNGPRTLASSGVIIVNGITYSPGSGAYTVTGSTVRFAGGTVSALPSCTFNNLEVTSGTVSMATGGVTQTILGNYTQSGGTFNLGNTASTNTMNVSGNFSMSAASIYNMINSNSSTGVNLNISGNFIISVTSGGKFQMETSTSSSSGVATVNLDGSLVSSATASAFLDLGNDTNTNNVFNIKGDFTHSGTGTFWTAGSSPSKGIVFNGTGVQNFNNSGGVTFQYTQFTVNAGSTLKLLSNVTLGTSTNPRSTFVVNGTLDMGTFVMAGSTDPTFTLASGGTLKIANATGMGGAFTGFTGTRTYSSTANYEFQGAATGTFTTSPTALTVNNLTINNSGGDVTMGQAFTVTGTLGLTAGRLLMGANNLTVSGSTSVAGFSAMGTDATSYVVTSGAGVFTMPLVSGVPKIYPIGLAGSDNTFNPIQLTNTGAGGNFSVKLDNTVNNTPNDPTRICNLDYDVTSAVSTISLAMSIQWEAANQATNFLPSNPVVVGHFTGGAWTENAAVVNGGPFPFYASTLVDFTSLSPFTPANALALPLELASFTGKTQEKSNVLYWETLSEKDVQWHIVERSTDGVQWVEVGRKTGQQESHISVKYQLEDRTPPAKAYYRLRSVDVDGQENLSNTVLLTREDKYFGINTVYPSPATDRLNVQFTSPVEENVLIRFFDLHGRLVLEQRFDAQNGINEVPVQIGSLQAGVYLVSISNATAEASPVRIVKE